MDHAGENLMTGGWTRENTCEPLLWVLGQLLGWDWNGPDGAEGVGERGGEVPCKGECAHHRGEQNQITQRGRKKCAKQPVDASG